MSPEERRSPMATLDFRERGRVDDREQLRLHLPEAGSDYLEGALENPNLGPDELVILIRNRTTTTEIVTRIGRNPAWMRSREIKVAVVENPRTPHVLARRFLPHLFWRDLAELASNLRVSPVLRRESEKLLATRLPELTLGEKIALARRGSRGVIEILREESDTGVLRAIAGNSRATEADLARIVARSDVRPDFLGWLADQSSWGQRREVRLALVRHPQTPPASALRLTHLLSKRDADDLRHDVSAPRLVRVAAERRFGPADPNPGGPRSRLG